MADMRRGIIDQCIIEHQHDVHDQNDHFKNIRLETTYIHYTRRPDR